MTHQTKRELLEDLEARMDNAMRNLDFLIERAEGGELTRLRGKREGVNLALSYVREYTRGGAA